ncbi:MarR family transcriptional regulator [Alcaligenes pakistanensis]|uniref:MarR family transcriptional regulator n=1 Tax=Alcaligenes pakistanensis TaxID=1482717 RepID=A0A8H9M4M2_9BURK|nr:MarR family transcriptional regulator [Alcaligenes pakistanensis]MBP6621692.1 MarR family transcriptional regulator [Alcaligenes sp.]GHC46725.1 MarR family transcriptional regulator [Alcaligenes pakistanensis]HCA16243.1 MarR family transcriptional regulator [Alcaligenes faecalis]
MSRPEADLWFSFVRAHRSILKEIERRLAAEKLPPYAWYDVLWGLETGPEGTRRMHELADRLAIERYNLTRLVDRLEAQGLVQRSRSSEDGRAAFASISDQGRDLRKQMWQVYQSTVQELFLSAFSEQEQSQFAQRLDQAARQARQSSKP